MGSGARAVSRLGRGETCSSSLFEQRRRVNTRFSVGLQPRRRNRHRRRAGGQRECRRRPAAADFTPQHCSVAGRADSGAAQGCPSSNEKTGAQYHRATAGAMGETIPDAAFAASQSIDISSDHAFNLNSPSAPARTLFCESTATASSVVLFRPASICMTPSAPNPLTRP